MGEQAPEVGWGKVSPDRYWERPFAPSFEARFAARVNKNRWPPSLQ